MPQIEPYKMMKLCEYEDNGGTYKFFLYSSIEICVEVPSGLWHFFKLDWQNSPRPWYNYFNPFDLYIPEEAKKMCEMALELDLFI